MYLEPTKMDGSFEMQIAGYDANEPAIIPMIVSFINSDDDLIHN